MMRTRFWADLRTLSWLRWREVAGGKRVVLIVAFAVVVVACAAAVAAAIAVSVRLDLIGIPAAQLVGPLWLFLIAGPVLGGGSAETGTVSRLAAIPVDPRSVFASACVAAGVDLPYMVSTPIVLGVGAGLGGVWGVLAGVTFVGSAVLVGQLGAWSWLAVAAGRGPGTRIAAGVVVVSVVAAGVVFGGAAAAVMSAPGEVLVWLSGSPVAASGALVVFVALVVPAVRVGGGRAAAAFATDPRPAARSKRVPVFVPGGVLGVWVASIRRSVSVQMTFVTLAATGLLPLVSANYPLRLTSVLAVTSVGLASILGVNLWSFAGGGLPVLLAAPLKFSLVAAPAAALGAVVAVGNVAVGAVAVLVGVRQAPGDVLVAVLGGAALLSGWSIWFSTRHPNAADWDSLRVRPAAPGLTLRFAVVSGVALGLLEAVRNAHDGVPALVWVAGCWAVAGGACWAALRSVRRHPERVAAAAAQAT